MTLVDTEEAACRLRIALADELEAKGDLTDPAWRKVFERVPRHAFVPEFWLAPDRRVTYADDDWLSLVYRDDVLVTQLTSGVATSSSTAPGLMLAMLHALDLRDDMSVLEVATGTGYNTALLCARVSSENATTIEVAAELAELAKTRLRKAGWEPTVLTTDGRSGHPAGAPYDRLIATCGFDRVPHAWIEQVRPGGVIVCPVGWGTVRLDVGGDGTASGRFLPNASYFMSVRAAHETGAVPYPEVPNALDERCTALDVSAPFGTDTFPFLLSLALPGTAQASDLDEEGNIIGCRLRSRDGSWARVEQGRVRQTGPRKLWDTAEAAHAWWQGKGQPGRERFGLTVDSDGQRLWLDEPDQAVPVAGG